jgi:hypothetical protein
VISTPLVIGIAFGYLGLLFAIAWWADRRAAQGRSVTAHPTVYALSLAVYCTAWTFYGSVGRAAADGIGFLPIYLGPTLIALLWGSLLIKMVRVGKAQRITSIADFIASRYGKSQALGGLVTIIAVVGVMPYISCSWRPSRTASRSCCSIPRCTMSPRSASGPFWRTPPSSSRCCWPRSPSCSAPGTWTPASATRAWWPRWPSSRSSSWRLHRGRHLRDARAAGARRSRPAAGVRAMPRPRCCWSRPCPLSRLGRDLVACRLRRDAAAAAVPGDRGGEQRRGSDPPCHLAVSALPAADQSVRDPDRAGGTADLSGRLGGRGQLRTDLPIAFERPWLALAVFIGGLSAATSMVIVETIALSTMVSNDLILPLLLRRWQGRPSMPMPAACCC